MTAFERYGKLRIEGQRLVGEDGRNVRLFGMSTHGLAWYPQYVCEETFRALRDSWNVNCIRLALYTHEYHGYCTDGDKQELKTLVCKGIDLAVSLGMYAIIDWHVLGEQTPLTYADEAVRFFEEISGKYPDCPNLLYEICNEPNRNAGWDDIKKYASRVIPVIRKNSPEAIVIVGTPNWSQRCDLALEDPLSFDGLLYSFHFYAASHLDKERALLERCLKAGLPVMVSECSLTEASGHGELDLESSESWFSLLDEYNISYMTWSLSASKESSSVFCSGCKKLSGWEDEDLKPTGLWFRNRFRSEKN